MSLDKQLLTSFMNGFYGYGATSASHWFIGMEEGGGKTLDEISARLAAWDNSGSPALVDLVDYHHAINQPEYFTGKIKTQKTWAQLIRVYLASTGTRNEPDLQDVKAFQSEHLGRTSGDTSLLELFPLPSQSKNVWRYPEFTNLEILQSRDKYHAGIVDNRIEGVKQLISIYSPKVVVFYGSTYRDWWKQISGCNFTDKLAEGRKFQYADKEQTQYAIVPHPVSHGVTNKYYQSIGRLLNEYQIG